MECSALKEIKYSTLWSAHVPNDPKHAVPQQRWKGNSSVAQWIRQAVLYAPVSFKGKGFKIALEPLKGDEKMKKKLSLQNGQKTPLKTAQRTNKLRKNIFKILFKGLEFLWLVIQIVERLMQWFRQSDGLESLSNFEFY